jgi:hypothetical protein
MESASGKTNMQFMPVDGAYPVATVTIGASFIGA